MRLVLDTNVVASALLWGGKPGLLLRAVREGRHTAFSSTPLLAELTDILGREKFQANITASLLSVDQIVDRYADLVMLVRPFEIPRTAPDPDDDIVIGTAIAAMADAVVTGDKALLSIGYYQPVQLVSVAETEQLLA